MVDADAVADDVVVEVNGGAALVNTAVVIGRGVKATAVGGRRGDATLTSGPTTGDRMFAAG